MSWNLISQQIVSDSTTATVTFSSIPQTYKTLKILGASRDTNSSGVWQVLLKPNGGTTNLSYKVLQFSESSGATTSSSGTTLPSLSNQSADEGNNYSNLEITIPNYASTTYAKSLFSDSVSISRSPNNSYIWKIIGLFNSTTAITSVGMSTVSGYFIPGTIFSIYGLN